MQVFTALMEETNHYNGKDTLFIRYVHIFDFTALFSSCADDKNNVKQLFIFSTNVIRHTVKTSYCCDILFVTSHFTLI